MIRYHASHSEWKIYYEDTLIPAGQPVGYGSIPIPANVQEAYDIVMADIRAIIDKIKESCPGARGSIKYHGSYVEINWPIESKEKLFEVFPEILKFDIANGMVFESNGCTAYS